MCFVNEGDWTADIYEDSYAVRAADSRCGECYEVIPAGSRCRHYYLQEHEECCLCVEDGYDDCDCTTPDYGETFEYDRCLNCDSFLAAIQAVELEEGCRPNESTPPLGALIEELSSMGREHAERYFRRASELSPELDQTGYTSRLRARAFHEQEG